MFDNIEKSGIICKKLDQNKYISYIYDKLSNEQDLSQNSL